MNFKNLISVLRKIKEIQRYKNTDTYEKETIRKIDILKDLKGNLPVYIAKS